MKSLLFFSRSGCLLPLLIILNLFFGWMIFKPLEWLAIGAALVLIFILNSIVTARKIISQPPRDSGVIDVEGEVMEEKKQLKTD